MRAWHVAAAVGVAAAVVWALPAAAQKEVPSARQYVEATAQSDAFEIMEAETALTGSRNPAVRTYAEMMLRDHQATSTALRQAAAEAKVQPPAMQVGADQAALLAALQGAGPDEFDALYARHQSLAHRAALTVQQTYASAGDAPALKRVAADAVPVIQRHLDEADRLTAALGA